MRMRKTIGLSLVLLVASTAAMAKDARSRQHHPVSSVKPKPAHSAPRLAKAHRSRRRAERRHAARQIARRPGLVRPGLVRHGRVRDGLVRHRAIHPSVRQRAGRAAPALPPPDRYIGAVQPIGKPEIGQAAWYGGGLVGRRTASGQRLDRVHITAAHRSLPLYSLVRVTNLRNGRSVIATINDRGPVSRHLLIDLSPKGARDLRIHGVAKVAVVPVAVGPRSGAARRRREGGR